MRIEPHPYAIVKAVMRKIVWHASQRSTAIARAGARRRVAARATELARRARSSHGNRPFVLRLANMYRGTAGIPEIARFADAVAAGSGGELKVEFINGWTRDDDRREETTTVTGVMRGWADLAWAGSRVFGVLGIRSLDPLDAPLLMRDYAAQAAVWRSGLPRDMLEPLDALGLVGLAVVPGAFRKPFSFDRPLIRAQDYDGRVIRTHESVVAEGTFRALGASPVLLSTAEMAAGPLPHVDALELHAQAIRGWGYEGHVTWNVNLWPRSLAIFASQRTLEYLGGDEKELLRRSAEQVAAEAVSAMEGQEDAERNIALPLCTAWTASDADIAEIRARVAPVYERLRTDPETRSFMERLERVVADCRRCAA